MVKSGPAVGSRRRRVLVVLGVACVAIALVVAVGSVAEHAAYAGKVLPGVHVDTTAVGGKTDAEARTEIQRLASTLESEKIEVRAGTHTFSFDPALIGYTVDVDATLARAKNVGRDGNPIALAADTLLRQFRSEDVPLVVSYDNARFQGLLDGWSNAVDAGLVEGSLRFQGTKVVPVMPKAGTGLQRDEAERVLRLALASSDRAQVELPTGSVQPQVDANAVTDAATRARALLAANKDILAGTQHVTLTPAALAGALGTRVDGHTLALTVDARKLAKALGPAFASLSEPPVDATWAVDAGNTVRVVPSRDGKELDTDALEADILRGSPTIYARYRNTHPVHDTAWAKKLGITKQVSSFTTYHSCCAPRVTNIHIAANVLNNTIVEPGKTFSLNEKLGPRTPEKGYQKAPILVEDGFGEDYGGGISQLTTTLFNAVFFGGYVDVEHSPHHFYISRYPMGREATINYPSVDLKFRNDTSHGVLIRTAYSDTSITVTFYGNNDGRVVHEENRKIDHTEPITENLVKCPVKKPEDDPNNDCATLTAGERKSVAPGETGYDVEFERVIDQPGKPEQRTHYRVHYPMLPEKILVGTTPATTTTTRPPKDTPPSTAPKGTTTTTKHS